MSTYVIEQGKGISIARDSISWSTAFIEQFAKKSITSICWKRSEFSLLEKTKEIFIYHVSPRFNTEYKGLVLDNFKFDTFEDNYYCSVRFYPMGEGGGEQMNIPFISGGVPLLCIASPPHT